MKKIILLIAALLSVHTLAQANESSYQSASSSHSDMSLQLNGGLGFSNLRTNNAMSEAAYIPAQRSNGNEP